MKYFTLFIALLIPVQLSAQDATVLAEPHHIVVDSKDNVFVTRKYGLVKIAPDRTITNLSKQGPVIGGMDRAWYDLIIDSKDNKLTVELDGDVKLTSKGKIEVEAQTDMNFKANGSMSLKASAGMDIQADGSVKVKGATVELN